MKHAYIITAYNEFEVLNTLLSLIDDARHDIFIHFESKISLPQNLYKPYHATLQIVPNRVKVTWGNESIIQGQLNAFECALAHGPYQYYHFLSGTDLPLQNMDAIHRFFNKHNGQLFIGFSAGKDTGEMRERLSLYHYFVRYYKEQNTLRGYVWRKLHTITLWLQRIIGVDRVKRLNVKKGETYCSLPHDFVEYLVSKRADIEQMIKRTFVPDEEIYQTLAYNSPFKDRIFRLGEGEYQGCMREIDWKRGNPYTWGADENDFNLLANSKQLFARKFSYRYPAIILQVAEKVRQGGGKCL